MEFQGSQELKNLIEEITLKMQDWIVEIISVLLVYASLAIYVVSVLIGLVIIITWLYGILIRRTSGLKAFYDAYAQYLRNKQK